MHSGTIINYINDYCREWFKQSLKEVTLATEIDDLMLQSLLAFLHKRETILTIASR